ncbi:hypothetical protein SAMN04515667_0058 [Formosa sp. Hel1_31_208]|uniref:hypothetical protein n=1 Tax=Formosa sp. Hel1_31_208 TaxID=1798225 RepID=UPI00087A1C48|nr:hypothetical protein [Formosa sp. Hel1_31_208]SDR65832.1 hypothetical protein SAMN04515667_0058 [Formosa sp. Hel1_31_208]
MKKLILVAMAFITLQAVAQDKPQEMQRASKKEGRQMMKDMSPEELATISTKKMTLALDLNDKQQAQVKTLFLEQATNRPKKRGAKKELTKEERVKMMNDRLDEQIAMKQKMKSILTNEQYVKYEKMQERRSQMGNKKRRMKEKQ